jgi:alcohol dehydrogenase class IV
MNFEFTTATRIIFGAGRLGEIGGLARQFGSRALVVTGRGLERAKPLVEALHAARVETLVYSISGEPEVGTVSEGAGRAKSVGCELVVGFGGGSAIDAGKAIAVMLTNGGKVEDYLEVIGHGKALEKAGAPFIAIPTTAGTGSEVTRNAVLASLEHRVKVSLRSPLMLARIALVDPQLTHGLPPQLTASTGLDALTQLIEPFVCARPNPITDALCIEAIPQAARSLPRVIANSNDADARQEMCVASLFGGLALANAGLGAVHGFAGPIGGMFSAPHGAVCAALLPHVMAINVRALRQRAASSETLTRYDKVAKLLTNDPAATADDGAAWVAQLVRDLHLPKLRDYGITREAIGELVGNAARASSMKANPIVLSTSELAEILERAI